MRFGLFASVLFHLAIVGAAVIVVPWSHMTRTFEAEPYIPLELIREAELDLMTSVPAAAPEPEEVEEPEPDLPEPVEEDPAPVQEEPEPAAPVEEEPEPAPVVEEPEPAPAEPERTPEPEPAQPEETPNVEPQRTAELDLDALSQLIDKERENEQTQRPRETPSQTTETADQERPAIGAGDRLTASTIQKMKSAVQPCWSVGSIIGAPEPEKLVVVLVFELNRDGSLLSPPRVENAMQINLSGNQFWKVAEREAISATNECAPYDFLPAEQYENWKEMRLVFNPAEMVGR